MHRILKPYFAVLVAFFALAAFFSMVDTGMAQPSECELVLTVDAPGAGDAPFEFEGFDEGGPFDFTLFAGVTETGFADFGPGYVVEIPPQGWHFDRIECEPGGGVEVISLSIGWFQDCFDPGSPTVCTIYNTTSASIPTLSEWGMMAAAAGFALIGMFYAVKRRKASA